MFYNRRFSILSSCSLLLFCHSFKLSISYNHPIHCWYCYLLDQLRTREIKYFLLPVFISFLVLFLFLCRAKFLNNIIFVLSEELLLSLLQGRCDDNKFHKLLFIRESLIYPLFLKDNFAGNTIPCW